MATLGRQGPVAFLASWLSAASNFADRAAHPRHTPGPAEVCVWLGSSSGAVLRIVENHRCVQHVGMCVAVLVPSLVSGMRMVYAFAICYPHATLPSLVPVVCYNVMFLFAQ